MRRVAFVDVSWGDIETDGLSTADEDEAYGWEVVGDDLDEHEEQVERGTDRVNALEERLLRLAPSYVDWAHSMNRRRNHQTDRTRRRPPPCMRMSEQLQEAVRQRSAVEPHEQRRERRWLHRTYGPAAATVKERNITAFAAVHALWQPESDGEYGCVAGPSYDVASLEPQAVEAIEQLIAELEEAMRAKASLALHSPCLSRRQRRVLLHNPICDPAVAKTCRRRRGEALPPLGAWVSIHN